MGDSKGTRVYVGNLTDKVKKEDLEEEFNKYGKLTSVWVAFNPPGFAFVEFENHDEAEKACDILNGTEALGSKLRVEISRLRPKHQRAGKFNGGGRGGGGFRDNRSGSGGFGGSRSGGFGGSRSGGGGGGGGFRSGGRGGGRGGRGGGSYDDGYSGGRSGGYSRDSFGGGRDSGSFGGGSRSGGSGGGGGRYRSRSPMGGGRRFN